jgi:hypothetical protein
MRDKNVLSKLYRLKLRVIWFLFTSFLLTPKENYTQKSGLVTISYKKTNRLLSSRAYQHKRIMKEK